MRPRRKSDGDNIAPCSYSCFMDEAEACASTEDWKQLYALCADPNVARAVAAVLPLRDPDLLASALLWKFLLEDLHPHLHLSIDLHRTAVASAV